ncbi:antitoxin [Rhodococcus sp. ARC_M6]|uniref:antitoxin n=1 Tax=Rhodococcus sp. ARC_M6 TaxID=2928852 RepID=UPI001FB1B6DB|nr:antitoxin [Rhodococcus sp. ARC_M6]MCJ0905265.1 antitoxin [Rhodococcus sp. ARC_M6]
MGFLDSVKGLVEKGQELASENSDKVHDAIDKVADIADGKTGGKYGDQIDKAAEAAKKAVPEKE